MFVNSLKFSIAGSVGFSTAQKMIAKILGSVVPILKAEK